MNIIINTYQDKPIEGLTEDITISITEVDGVLRRYFINNGVRNSKGQVFTYDLYYTDLERGGTTNAQRSYRNLYTALTDAAVYVSQL